MEITFKPNGWRPDFLATCSDPAADCHYVCAEGCESWGEVVRNEDGNVLHHLSQYGGDYDDLRHHMTHVEECNYIGFLDVLDDVTESMTGDPFTFSIPAIFTYDDEAVTWEATK